MLFRSAFTIGGLPFTSLNVTGIVGTMVVTTESAATTPGVYSGSVNGNATTVAITGSYQGPNNGTFTNRATTAADIGASAVLTGVIDYISAT